MASERQTAANRANAQWSSGPRSIEGKARVASNALKHGLAGKQVVLPGEDPAEFDDFHSELIADLAPQGALEGIFAEKIIADAWRFRRALQLVPTLYQREQIEAKLRAAQRDVQACMTNPMNELMETLSQPPSEVRPGQREAHQAAVARLREIEEEPDAPLVSTARLVDRLNTQLSNLERYETTLFRSLTKALHELQRLQAMRAGERVPVPAAVDVDVTIDGNGAVNPE